MNAAIDYIRSIGHKTWCHAVNENECQCGYHEARRLIEINTPTNRVLETDTIDGAIRKLDRRVHELETGEKEVVKNVYANTNFHFPWEPIHVPPRPVEPNVEPSATCFMPDKIKVKVWPSCVFVYDDETLLGALLR
jgi:hypothetical protein